MKRPYTTFFTCAAYGLLFTATFAVAFFAQPQSAPPPETLRRIVTATSDATIQSVTVPHTTVADIEYRGWKGTNYDGRCLLIAAPYTRVHNVLCVPGDGDSLCLKSDSHGTVIVNTEVKVVDWKASKALIAYTGSNSNLIGPMFGADVGFAAQFIGCKLQGSEYAGRIRDGVWNFIDCDLWVSALSALDLVDPCRANFIDCRFHTIPKPAEAPYWGTGVPIRLYALKNGQPSYSNLKSRIFVSGATLDGQPVTGPKLCVKAPASVWLKTPNN